MRLTIPRVLGRGADANLRGRLATADAAFVDPLTGLPEVRAFEVELARQVELARDSGQLVSLLSVDIVDLRGINDSAGQAAGDAALRGVAEALTSVARVGDHVYRTGGDEFAVIMPGIAQEEAIAAAERMLHFARRPAGDGPSVAFSGGLSSVPAFARTASQLRQQAEIARRWAARQGGAVVGVFDPDRDDDAAHATSAESAELSRILHARALTPVYQPIVDLASGRVLGFEGLIRPDPTGSLPEASRLFDVAAAADRTTELDIICVEAIVRGSSGIDESQVLTLNLSSRTLAAREFDVDWLLDRLSQAGIATNRVIVEVAGSQGVEDPRRLRSASDLLHRYGVRLAAEDLAVVSTTSELVSYLGFDLLKVDLGALAQTRSMTDPLTAMRTFRDMAAAREAIVIAERIETPAQLRVLHDLGITTAQGFLLGRPGRAAHGDWVDLGSLVPSSAPITTAAARSPREAAALAAAMSGPVRLQAVRAPVLFAPSAVPGATTMATASAVTMPADPADAGITVVLPTVPAPSPYDLPPIDPPLELAAARTVAVSVPELPSPTLAEAAAVDPAGAPEPAAEADATADVEPHGPASDAPAPGRKAMPPHDPPDPEMGMAEIAARLDPSEDVADDRESTDLPTPDIEPMAALIESDPDGAAAAILGGSWGRGS